MFHLLGAYQKLPKEENRTTHEYHSRLPHHLFSNVNHGIPWLVIDLFIGEGGASCINHISNNTRLNKCKVFPWLKASNATAAKHTLSHLVCHQCATLQIRWHQDCAMTLLWHNQLGTQPWLILQGKKHEKTRGKANKTDVHVLTSGWLQPIWKHIGQIGSSPKVRVKIYFKKYNQHLDT